MRLHGNNSAADQQALQRATVALNTSDHTTFLRTDLYLHFGARYCTNAWGTEAALLPCLAPGECSLTTHQPRRRR